MALHSSTENVDSETTAPLSESSSASVCRSDGREPNAGSGAAPAWSARAGAASRASRATSPPRDVIAGAQMEMSQVPARQQVTVST